MKTIIKSFIIIGLLGVCSCSDDFLDLQPQQSVSDDVFLQSLSDFEAAMTGLYDQMSIPDWYGRYMLLIPDIMGEDVKQNASANRAKEWAEYTGSNATLHATEREFWFELYEAINTTNAMINSDFQPVATAQADFNQLIGEAYAVRGLAYFDLVRLFAQHYTFTAGATHPGVPIVTAFDVTNKPSRNTVAEVYAQVISDLTTGAGLMTQTYNNAGRFTREGAQAILSRVYLYMEDWANAEAMATTVMNSGRFSLISNADYPQIFFGNKNSSEAIVELQYSLSDNNGSDALGGMYRASGYGDYLPSQDWLNLFAPNDIRQTMVRNDPNIGGIFGNLRVDKYPSDGSDVATDNLPVVRLSEVILNRAEARARQGNDAGAIADLDMIKARADLTFTGPTALSGAALIDEILLERRRELAYEGHRIFDMTRNRQNLVRGDCTSPICNVTYPNDRFILALPLPELDANPNIAQNPGY